MTVGEPTQEETVAILEGLRDRYEAHHKLTITDEAIKAAVTMSSRYIGDRYLPDKAIDLMDEAASRVRMSKLTPPPELKEMEGEVDRLASQKEEAIRGQDFEYAASLRDKENEIRQKLGELRDRWMGSQRGSGGEVTEEDIAAVVSSWTGIPVTQLTEGESERLLKMEEIIHQRVIGQEEAVSAVAKAIRRGRVGLKDPKRPTGSFIFLGPTGVGKTELSKALAEAMFGDEDAMIRVDMSEFMEKHSVSKLIGSPPGYVGYDEAGQLTEKVRRRPYSVLLFDEIEKAHEDVFNILLQILEDGILTDSQGRKVDFKNCILVMTSNVGAKNITERKKKLGFDTADSSSETKSMSEIKEAVLSELKKSFKPEFLNRVDDIIVFHQLDKEHIKKISVNMLKSISDRLRDLEVELKVEESAFDLLTEKGFDPVYGARPLRRAIQTHIEDALAEKILDGSVKKGGAVTAYAEDGKILFK